MDGAVRKSSLEELRGRIAAGEYSLDSGKLAGDILSKFALVRHVGRDLTAEEAGGEGRAPQPRRRRGARPESASPLKPPRERLQ